MAGRVVWLWENHLGQDAARLDSLRDEREKLDLRLEAVLEEMEAIQKAATTRAKSAGDKKKPFTL